MVQTYLLRELAMRKWLEQCLDIKLPDDQNLYHMLKDGVCLCKLMLTLRPKSIPRIYENQVGFRMKENLFFFLEALSEHAFPSKKIFTVPDLYEEKNLLKVL